MAGFGKRLPQSDFQRGGAIFFDKGYGMKTRFWKVQIETYEDGRVLANVLGSREAVSKPADGYYKNQWHEAVIRWYENEATAQDVVTFALNKKAVAA